MKVRARPRQLASGAWIQASLRGGTPAGYCVGHAEAPHATAAEAALCWRRYLLEQTLRLDGKRAEAAPCKACGKATTGTVVINGYPRDYWCPGTCATVENVAAWWNEPGAEAQAGG